MGITMKALGVEQLEWLIEINNEAWKFPNPDEMKKVLMVLIELKDKYGRIDKRCVSP